MCLFAVDRERTQPCDHPECLEFYKLVSRLPSPETNPLGQAVKRPMPKTEPLDYERPSKKNSGKMEIKGPVGPFVPKLLYKEERGDTLYMPTDEMAELQSKFNQQTLDFHRAKFRETSMMGQNEQSMNGSGQDNTLSSYGMFALNRAANAPSQYGTKSMPYSQKNSAFQIFSNPAGGEDTNNNVMNLLLAEVRAQTKLSMEILEKVDVHNKMLSILIKDYQLSKYSRFTQIGEKDNRRGGGGPQEPRCLLQPHWQGSGRNPKQERPLPLLEKPGSRVQVPAGAAEHS